MKIFYFVINALILMLPGFVVSIICLFFVCRTYFDLVDLNDVFRELKKIHTWDERCLDIRHGEFKGEKVCFRKAYKYEKAL